MALLSILKTLAGWGGGLSETLRSDAPSTGGLLRELLRDEAGQDLIEYGLLAGTVGFAGVLAFNFLSDTMNSTYDSWNSAGQSDELVELPCPVETPDCMETPPEEEEP